MSNTTGSSYLSGAPEITPVFGGVSVAQSLVFYVVFCVLLVICWSFCFIAMALSVYLRLVSLNVPLVSLVTA